MRLKIDPALAIPEVKINKPFSNDLRFTGSHNDLTLIYPQLKPLTALFQADFCLT
jgi:hypothetical protein